MKNKRVKIQSLGLAAIVGLIGLAYPSTTLAQSTPEPLTPNSLSPNSLWYNCLTREVWTPAKRAWCQKVEMLRNATYTIPQNPSYVTPEMIPVKLTNGRYEDAARQFSLTFATQRGTILFGDLNGDRLEDAVSLLTLNTGGSGVFTYLVASVNQDGALKPSIPVLLGDRIQFQSMAIESGKINVSMVTQGPNDPMCCPTLAVTHSFTLQYQLLPEP
ncbi:MAG: hypothetical protein HY785_02505 [Oscillatoriophycideae cyanobacterium NC_groundwater_1537_Pr4_S-0.65um_50_18]|nr:hypothetical protein [Oscillatoriophycideae cyanobacterium NC_groundwater_1537_Pr4_S-0.65um_50_18]